LILILLKAMKIQLSMFVDPTLQTDLLSANWFCLAYKNISKELDDYRKQIFSNVRALMQRLPEKLYQESSEFRVIPADDKPDLCFIDIKVYGPLHALRGSLLASGYMTLSCLEKGVPVFYRQSLGYYHSNFTMIFCESNTTIRLTLGLDPIDVDSLFRGFSKDRSVKSIS